MFFPFLFLNLFVLSFIYLFLFSYAFSCNIECYSSFTFVPITFFSHGGFFLHFIFEFIKILQSPYNPYNFYMESLWEINLGSTPGMSVDVHVNRSALLIRTWDILLASKFANEVPIYLFYPSFSSRRIVVSSPDSTRMRRLCLSHDQPSRPCYVFLGRVFHNLKIEL